MAEGSVPAVGATALPDMFDRLMEEVEREARRRRGAGEVPQVLEREADAAFERYAPKGGGGGSQAADLLAVAERASVIDAAVPVQARRPGEAAARRLLRMSMAWYVGHLAQQSSRFASAELRLARTLEQRLSALEARAGFGGRHGSSGHQAPERAPVSLSGWRPLATELLGGTKGRVLHAECGDGWLLSELVNAGLDAYGVDPVDRLSDPGGLDMWSEPALAHLRSVSDGGLDGLVLSGCVECVSPDGARRLAGLAAAKLAPGGRLLLIASNPPAVSRVAPTPSAELANGRSMHPPTWQHLLSSAGLVSTAAHVGADSFVVTAQAGPQA